MGVGVERRNRRMKCLRCGNDNKNLFGMYQDTIDFQTVYYCRFCSRLVQANSKEELAPTKRLIAKTSEFSFELPFSLTNKQKNAVFQIKGNLVKKNMILLQAVCGAGKTEIIAAVIANELKNGKYVGWAIARKDVVIEISERLKEYFPKTKIIALYQDSQDLEMTGQLTVLTTARLYDFYQYFDLLVIDENDAYPFNIDKYQQYAAQQAITKAAVTLHISATITKEEKSRYNFITSITRRFHDYELPSIQFEYYPLKLFVRINYISNKMKERLITWRKAKYPIFIFVSSKKLGKQLKKYFQDHLLDFKIIFVSSEITDRTPILQSIRRNEVDILITTTILERGVTFKALQVIVIDADSAIFDAPTLVQIAGRVGRNIDTPDGKIIFCYQTQITEAMRRAKLYHHHANLGKVDFL